MKRKTSTIPFGYKIDPTNSAELIRDEKELLAIQKARQYHKVISLRNISAMIEKETGRKLSPRGCKQVMERSWNT